MAVNLRNDLPKRTTSTEIEILSILSSRRVVSGQILSKRICGFAHNDIIHHLFVHFVSAILILLWINVLGEPMNIVTRWNILTLAFYTKYELRNRCLECVLLTKLHLFAFVHIVLFM